MSEQHKHPVRVTVHAEPFPTLNITTMSGACLLNISPEVQWSKVQKWIREYSPILDLHTEHINTIKFFLQDQDVREAYEHSLYEKADDPDY